MEELLLSKLALAPYFFLVFLRVSAMVLLLPYLGSPSVPWQLKMGLSGFLSLVVVSYISPVPINPTLSQFVLYALKEVFVGVVVGFVARLIFDSAQLAGQFIGYQMGFAIANVLDPNTSTQISVISQFKVFLVVVLLLVVDAHHLLVQAIVRSFSLVPVTGVKLNGLVAESISKMVGDVFSIALRISAPVMVALLITNVVLAVIGRTMPQINVFIMGFPLEIGVGFLVFYLSMPFWIWCYRVFFRHFMEGVSLSLKLMGGY